MRIDWAYVVIFSAIGPLANTWMLSQMAVYFFFPLLELVQGGPNIDWGDTGKLLWRVCQAVFGLLSAIVISGSLALILVGNVLKLGLIYQALFFLVSLMGPLVLGDPGAIVIMLSIPDTWSFILTSVTIFFLVQRSRLVKPPNLAP